jgi:hypothetical protein
MSQYYSERDLYWQKELEKIDRDTMKVLEKNRNEKEYLTHLLK